MHRLGMDMPVQGQKYVIVGGLGLVGGAVARALAQDQRAEVIVCDRFGDVTGQKWTNLPANLDDIWTPESLLTNLDKAWREIAGVIILADDSGEHQDCDALFETAFHLPRRIWDFCVAKQRPIAWASSAHVYGAGPSHLSTEANDVAALAPVTAFGRAKQAFDVFAARQGTGPHTPPLWCGLRLSSVYGPCEAHKGASASLPVRAMRSAAQGTPLDIWESSGLATRDWIHVEDAAFAIAELVAGQHPGFFDVGTGSVVTTNELLAQVDEVTQSTLALREVDMPSFSESSQPPANIAPLAEAGLSTRFRPLKEGLTCL
jgi:nucleoside-diphosphate-sugar epimerase